MRWADSFKCTYENSHTDELDTRSFELLTILYWVLIGFLVYALILTVAVKALSLMGKTMVDSNDPNKRSVMDLTMAQYQTGIKSLWILAPTALFFTIIKYWM